MRETFINGRFTTAPLTGVQRHAWAIVSRLKTGKLIRPGKSWLSAVGGHVWEQSVLPWASRHGVLWSPCNVGPISHLRHVVTIHDCAAFDVPEAFSFAFGQWYRGMLPLLAKRARTVLTVSDFSKSRIVEWLRIPEEKVVVCGNGVSADFGRRGPAEVEKMRQALGINFPYVLSLGSDDPRKNFELAARAARAFEGKDAPHFLFVGGASRRVFGTGSEGGKGGPNVRYLGYVEESRLPALYSGAQAFLFPSRYEGFGLPVLEAMACGTPVVAADIPSVREVAGDAALFFPSGDEAGLVAVLEKLLGDKELSESLTRAGLDRVAKFTWDSPVKIVAETLKAAAET